VLLEQPRLLNRQRIEQADDDSRIGILMQSADVEMRIELVNHLLFQISSEMAFPTYRHVGAGFARLVQERQVCPNGAKPVTGPVDEDRISTSHIERVNLSVRTFLRRFTRLALGFSKSKKHLEAAVAVWVLWYNFARIHGSLRVTPAMEAGISDRVWTVADLIDNADGPSYS
jgi:hypothetical protein